MINTEFQISKSFQADDPDWIPDPPIALSVLGYSETFDYPDSRIVGYFDTVEDCENAIRNEYGDDLPVSYCDGLVPVNPLKHGPDTYTILKSQNNPNPNALFYAHGRGRCVGHFETIAEAREFIDFIAPSAKVEVKVSSRKPATTTLAKTADEVAALFYERKKSTLKWDDLKSSFWITRKQANWLRGVFSREFPEARISYTGRKYWGDGWISDGDDRIAWELIGADNGAAVLHLRKSPIK